MTPHHTVARLSSCSTPCRLVALLSKPEKSQAGNVAPAIKAKILWALAEFTTHYGDALTKERLQQITQKAFDLLKQHADKKEAKNQSFPLMSAAIECLSTMLSFHDISGNPEMLRLIFLYGKSAMKTPDSRILNMPNAGLLLFSRQVACICAAWGRTLTIIAGAPAAGSYRRIQLLSLPVRETSGESWLYAAS